MYNFYKTIPIKGLRFPKIFNFQNKWFLIGSKKYRQCETITKYGLQLFELNNNLELTSGINNDKFIDFDVYPYLDDIALSCWIRDVYIENNELYLNVEIKKNINNENFSNDNLLIKTIDCIQFNFVKKYEITDILFKDFIFENKQYTLTSKIEIDVTNKQYFWGKYLFEFIINNKITHPQFDAIVDYTADKGHILHNVEYNSNTDTHTILFSIRHKIISSVPNEYMYKIYSANTKDFIQFYDTKEVQFLHNTNDITSKWFSYPHKFTMNNNDEFIICNQDDFGKNSLLVVFKKIPSLEKFVSELYDNYSLISCLNFTTNTKYIYYDELKNKSGKRYDEIIKKNEDITEYSNYAPSCTKLMNLLNQLKIKETDSILDIGCGRGYALALFNKFPFNNISGIEINTDDTNICINNIHTILQCKNTCIINDDILFFNEYDKYNYFYLYNPFSSHIFNIILLNIKPQSFLIYKNIHDKELEQLKNHSFEYILQEKGEERDYHVFLKNK